MIYNTLPKDPQKRQAIVFLEHADIIELSSINPKKKSQNKWIDDEKIALLEYPFDSGSPIFENKLYKSLKDSFLIEKNMILSQNPYDLDQYKNASDMESLVFNNCLKKYTLFSGFCRKLGATKIYGKQIEIENNSENTKSGLKGGHKPTKIKGELKVENSWEDKVRKELVLEDTFHGNPEPDIDGARNLLIFHNLLHEDVFTSLLDARADRDYKITKREISFSLTNESKHSLKVISSINTPIFNLDGSYEKKINKLNNLQIKLIVEFNKG